MDFSFLDRTMVLFQFGIRIEKLIHTVVSIFLNKQKQNALIIIIINTVLLLLRVLYMWI
jgi:hypothetical protein